MEQIAVPQMKVYAKPEEKKLTYAVAASGAPIPPDDDINLNNNKSKTHKDYINNPINTKQMLVNLNKKLATDNAVKIYDSTSKYLNENV